MSLHNQSTTPMDDPREQKVMARFDPEPDPALLSDGIPAYMRALEASLRGDARMADYCSACSYPRAWHYDASQMLLMGCEFAQRVSRRPELRAFSPASIDRDPSVSQRVFKALLDGQCGALASILVAGFTPEEVRLMARDLTNVVIVAQQEVDDAA